MFVGPLRNILFNMAAFVVFYSLHTAPKGVATVQNKFSRYTVPP